MKSSPEQLRALAARLRSRQDEKSRWAARRIHDDLAQGLTALSLELSLLQQQLDSTKAELPGIELRQQIAGFAKVIADLTQSTQSVMARLWPKLLDDFGLIAALEF